MKTIFKSIAKGAKYAGLAFAAGAVGAVSQDLPGVVDFLLNEFSAPQVITVLVNTYGVPYAVAAVTVAVQQIIKHRDKVFTSSK